MFFIGIIATVLPFFLPILVSGHSAFWHPSMFGFNVTDKTFPYDNRPVAPIKNMNFQQWWFHNHLDYPPNPGDIFNLPAGQPVTAEIACNKGATSYFASADGGDIREANNPNNVCPGSPSIAYHTQGLDDLEGCALAIAYKSDVRAVQPEDFTVFSVNQTCVWTRFTDFQVPERMPPCPEDGCICSFFWVHSPKSGGEENYMNGFKCNVTGSTSSVPVAKSELPRRCGTDADNNKNQAVPANCTYGAKTPFYWFNLEHNNMFEGTFSPPVYNDLYNFLDGSQDDIFEDSYSYLPEPAPNAPMPILADLSNTSDSTSGDSTTTSATMSTTTNISIATSTATSSPTPSTVTTSQPSSSPTPPASSNSTKGAKSCSSRNLKASLSTRSFDDEKWNSIVPRSVVRMTRTSRKLHAGNRHRLWHMW